MKEYYEPRCGVCGYFDEMYTTNSQEDVVKVCTRWCKKVEDHDEPCDRFLESSISTPAPRYNITWEDYQQCYALVPDHYWEQHDKEQGYVEDNNE